MEMQLRPVIQTSIETYTSRSKRLIALLEEFFKHTPLPCTKKKSGKLAVIAHSITTMSSTLVALVLLKWYKRVMTVSSIQALANLGASHLVSFYNSYQLSQRNENLYERFIIRLNDVVTAMEPWIQEYPQSKNRLDSAGPSDEQINNETLIHKSFANFSVTPFAHLYMSGGMEFGSFLTISRNEFLGQHLNTVLINQLRIATRLCREFIIQQNKNVGSEEYKMGLEEETGDSVFFRIQAFNAILAGHVPNPNAEDFLSVDELSNFKLAYFKYKTR